MKAKISIFLFAAFSILFISGCKNEGMQGPAGQDGNANVTASPWYPPTAWKGSAGDWYFDIKNSAISQDIVESGVILAYVSLPGDLYNDYTVRPLPAYAIGANWDFLIPNDGKTYGSIEFTSDMVNTPGIAGYNFRFILISSSYILKSASLTSTGLSDLKKMTYKEVCKLFNIAE